MELLFNLSLEMALFAFLGVLYYFYQKKRILRHEAEKTTYIMSFLLEATLSERGEHPHERLDPLIEAIDDYLHNRTSAPPVGLLKLCAEDARFSAEYRDVLQESIRELSPEE